MFKFIKSLFSKKVLSKPFQEYSILINGYGEFSVTYGEYDWDGQRFTILERAGNIQQCENAIVRHKEAKIKSIKTIVKRIKYVDV